MCLCVGPFVSLVVDKDFEILRFRGVGLRALQLPVRITLCTSLFDAFLGYRTRGSTYFASRQYVYFLIFIAPHSQEKRQHDFMGSFAY